MRRMLWLPILLLTPAFLFAQYEVSVTTVHVWVKATDKGQPVAGLKADDFEIFEDGRRMSPSCFEEVIAPAPQPEIAAQVAATSTPDLTKIRPQPQKFVILLDLVNTSALEYVRVEPKIRQLLDQIEGKQWAVMLVKFQPSGKLEITPFTTDFRMLKSRLANTAGSKTLQIRDKHRQDLITELLVQARTNYISYGKAYSLARAYSIEERDEALFSLSALQSLGEYLVKTTEGEHLVLLYVSGGFNVDPGRNYYEMVDRVEPTGQGAFPEAENHPKHTHNLEIDVQSAIKTEVGKLSRSNITVYTINTKGTAIADGMSVLPGIYSMNAIKDYQDSLYRVAAETGGIAFENSDNFAVGFDKVLADVAHQYILCYSAPNHEKQGDYHRIKVVSERPGVELRYRHGYVD